MIIKAKHIKRYRGGIHWQEVEDLWDPEAQGGAGASEGEYLCGQTRGKEWLFALEHWRGLFGGIPGGWKPPIRPEDNPALYIALYLEAKLNGQVQEVTQTPFLRMPDRDLDLEIPGEEDLHQLDPSASFQGTRQFVEYKNPIELSKGTILGVRFLCSQQKEGAHIRTTFWTSKRKPK